MQFVSGSKMLDTWRESEDRILLRRGIFITSSCKYR